MTTTNLGGARENAGRHPLEGGRHDLPFVALATDKASIEAAAEAADVPVTDWIREAAEQAMTGKIARVRLPNGQERGTLYATIPGTLRPRLEARAAELGIGRLGTFLRLACLQYLKATTEEPQ